MIDFYFTVSIVLGVVAAYYVVWLVKGRKELFFDYFFELDRGSIITMFSFVGVLFAIVWNFVIKPLL